SKKYFISDEEAFDALNKIIRFVEEENKDLLDRKESPFRVFPNQIPVSSFVEKRALSRDVKIPLQIKDVLKTIGEDWYEKLVRDEISVFERESKLTIKDASDKIKEKIDKYFSGKLKEEEITSVQEGLFQLIGYSFTPTDSDFETLHKFAKRIFPDRTPDRLHAISVTEDFDYKPCQLWAIKTILKKVSEFSNLNNLSKHLFNTDYPEIKPEYSEAEKELMYRVDVFLNELIQYAIS